MITNIGQIRDALRRLGSVHVSLVEYRMTLGYAHLRLTGESYHDVKAHLILGYCDYISGPTFVGPCSVAVKSRADIANDVIEVEAEPCKLLLRATRMSLGYPDEIKEERIEVGPFK